MNQAAFKDQILLGTIRKCSKNTSMDCRIYLCAGGHCKEKIYAQTIFVRNTTNFKHIHF